MGLKPSLASLEAFPRTRKETGPKITGRVVIPAALASWNSSTALLKFNLKSVASENSGTT